MDEEHRGLRRRGDPAYWVELQRIRELARRSLIPYTQEIQIIDGPREISLSVTRKGVGPIIVDDIGDFFMFLFEVDDQWRRYIAVVYADLDAHLQPEFSLEDGEPLPVRIDSGCETGQVFHDSTCECGPQIEEAMRRFAKTGAGILISIPEQDGRGKGLPFKLATLTLQAQLNENTIHAARTLEPTGAIDERSYGGSVAVLRALGVGEAVPIRLVSNNPEKLAALQENGFQVSLDPIVVGVNDENRRHLEAKHEWLGHETLQAPPGPAADIYPPQEERDPPDEDGKR